MDVEHVARIGLASRRLAGEQRNLAVRGGMLGHVVDDDQRVLAAVAEILGHREAGEGCDPLQAGRRRRARHDEDAAFRRAVTSNRIDDALDRGRLLADRDVDADDVTALLIDDAIDGDRGLTDRAVADDQLALAAPEREHGIDTSKPVCTGSLTKSRSMIAGAGRSTGSVASRHRLRRRRRAAGRADRPMRPSSAGPPARDHLAGAAHPIARLDSFGLVEQDASERHRGPV